MPQAQAIRREADNPVTILYTCATPWSVCQSVMSLSRYAQPRGLHVELVRMSARRKALKLPAISTLNFRVQGLHRQRLVGES